MSYSSLPGELKNTPFDRARVMSAVGEGWWPLLVEAHERISSVDPGYRVFQFDEKFGALRLYVGTSDEKFNREVNAIIADLEERSQTTCEQCGRTGALRKGGWLKTLCDDHADGREPTGHREFLYHPFS